MLENVKEYETEIHKQVERLLNANEISVEDKLVVLNNRIKFAQDIVDNFSLGDCTTTYQQAFVRLYILEDFKKELEKELCY